MSQLYTNVTAESRWLICILDGRFRASGFAGYYGGMRSLIFIIASTLAGALLGSIFIGLAYLALLINGGEGTSVEIAKGDLIGAVIGAALGAIYADQRRRSSHAAAGPSKKSSD